MFSQSLDSAKVEQWVQDARALMVSDPDSSRNLAFTLYDYSNLHQYDWGRAQGFLFVGASFHRQGSFDTAVFYFDRVIQINNTLQDTLQIGSALLNKAMCLVSTGKYEEGARNTLESMKLLESIIDASPRARSSFIRCFNIMGQVYYYQADFIKTKEYFLKYLEEATRANDTLLIASANNNLAAVYYELGDFDKSLEHDLRGAEIHKQLNNPMGYANAMQNIGTDLIERQDFDKADEYLKVALDWYQRVPNQKGVSEVYCNLGKLSSKRSQLDAGLQWYDRAVELALEIKNPDVLKKSLLGLSDTYQKLGAFKRAYDYYIKYDAISDSLVNLDHLNMVSELEIAYDTEQKEQQIKIQAAALLQGELEQERNQLIIFSLVILIALIMLSFVWLLKRHQYQRNLLLERERTRAAKAQIQAVIHSQEEERSRFAMDLHDDFGQLISALRIHINQQQNSAANGLLDEMYASLKNIAFNLMPQTLVEKGLVEATDELCFQLNKLGGVTFKMTAFEVDESAIALHKVGLYRILQELLSNIIKHGSASKVDISITGLEGEMNIMIEDDGVGYDPQQFISGYGNGWRNISSRLDLMEGTIIVDSAFGRKNSSVSINVPYVFPTKNVA